VTLKVEPGAYWPWVVQLMIGCPPDLPNSALNCRWEMPPVQIAGIVVRVTGHGHHPAGGRHHDRRALVGVVP
jgi:hypothetical protein